MHKYTDYEVYSRQEQTSDLDLSACQDILKKYFIAIFYFFSSLWSAIVYIDKN